MPSALTLSRRHWRPTVGLATIVLVALAILVSAMSTAGQVPLSKHIAATHVGHRTLIVGPGPVQETIPVGGYRVDVSLTPNRSTSNGIVSVKLTKRERPARAHIRLTTTMLTMDMGYTGLLTQTEPGRYMHAWPALGMGGRWRLQFVIAPTSGKRFTINLIDHPS